MSKERLSEVRELLFQLERRIAPLAWDAGRNQINEFKKMELGRLQEEYATLSGELAQLEKEMVEQKELPEGVVSSPEQSSA